MPAHDQIQAHDRMSAQDLKPALRSHLRARALPGRERAHARSPRVAAPTVLLVALALNAPAALATPRSAPGEGTSASSSTSIQESAQGALAVAPRSAPGEGESSTPAAPPSVQPAGPAPAQGAAATPGGGPTTRTASASAETGTAAGAPGAPARAGSTAPAAPTPAPGSAAGPSTAGTQHPRTAGSAGHGTRRHNARRHAARRESARTRNRTGVLAAAPGNLQAGRENAAGSAPRLRHGGGRSQSNSPGSASAGLNPIRTIERVVHSVPQPIWMMIAILAALSLLLGLRSVLANVRARHSERERALLARAVGTLQAALLPAIPARVAGVATSVAYRPAEGPGAGGDFYDIFALSEGRLGVIVGDVAGHGEHALPKTALLRYTLRTYLDSGLPPRAALAAAAAGLDERLEGTIATALLAVLDPHTGRLVYASAGHPPPLIPGAPEIEPLLASAAPPIGTGVRTGLRQTELQLAPGTRICFYTDGLIEARSRGELLGLARVRGELEALGADASAPALLERVAALADQRPDDMATCLLTLPGTGNANANGCQGAPLIRAEELEVDREAAASARPALFLTAAGLSAERSAQALSALSLVLRDAPSALIRVTTPAHASAAQVEVFPISRSIIQLSPAGLSSTREIAKALPAGAFEGAWQ
jgi:hypothetical protein